MGGSQMNGAHRFTVEDGAIVGRTVEASASMNSFLCTTREFDDFELELRDGDRSHHQLRNSDPKQGPSAPDDRPRDSNPRPAGSMAHRSRSAGTTRGSRRPAFSTVKRWARTGCRRSRRSTPGITTSSTRVEHAPDRRARAAHPDMGQWESRRRSDNDEVYKSHSERIHRLADSRPQRARSEPSSGLGITTKQPLVIKWRHIRIRPLSGP